MSEEIDYSNRKCSNCSLGQEGKCELGLEKECVTATNNDEHGDYWIDRNEGEDEEE